MAKGNVFLFIPNVIGYFRVVLTIVSYVFFFDDPVVFLGCYTLGFALDGADGMAARYFNQCSRFGAIFDMITDRAATAGFVSMLSHLYVDNTRKETRWIVPTAAALLIGLDFVSHYVRMYSVGGVFASHKDTSTTRNPILKVYYSSRLCLQILCMGQEGFYLFLYACHFWSHPLLSTMLWISAPIMAAKQIVNVIQFWEGVEDVVKLDYEDQAKASN
eukprot:TRINITY_DN38186_c0_g1_i1.p1 TRINITY_DN38186_c0_g1~~TRINITY_DN38186_c0_g1_i1.p1  ORF type:complete len:217 (+),score=73.41 TRINITY_DN38186_c0_g1_i1:45-695(+)